MQIKALVIDDDKAITDLMKMLLETQGYEVFAANYGEEGVKLAREVQPHVILLDLMMPDLDGYEVCRAVRNFSDVPILVLSAVSDPAMISAAVDAGADGFLVKPVPTSVLVAHIRKLLRPQTGALGKNAPPAISGASAAAIRNTQPVAS